MNTLQSALEKTPSKTTPHPRPFLLSHVVPSSNLTRRRRRSPDSRSSSASHRSMERGTPDKNDIVLSQIKEWSQFIHLCIDGNKRAFNNVNNTTHTSSSGKPSTLLPPLIKGESRNVLPAGQRGKEEEEEYLAVDGDETVTDAVALRLGCRNPSMSLKRVIHRCCASPVSFDSKVEQRLQTVDKMLRRRGLPPVSPHAASRDAVMAALVNQVWRKAVPHLYRAWCTYLDMDSKQQGFEKENHHHHGHSHGHGPPQRSFSLLLQLPSKDSQERRQRSAHVRGQQDSNVNSKHDQSFHHERHHLHHHTNNESHLILPTIKNSLRKPSRRSIPTTHHHHHHHRRQETVKSTSQHHHFPPIHDKRKNLADQGIVVGTFVPPVQSRTARQWNLGASNKVRRFFGFDGSVQHFVT